MSDMNKIYKDISEANISYMSAVARNTGIIGARDRLKNLLFTHRDVILQLLSGQDDLQKKLADMTEEEQLRLLSSDGMLVKRPIAVKEDRDVLNTELEIADAENDELRKKIKELQRELDDLYDQHNHDISDLEMQVEQQEEEKSSCRKKRMKTMTAVVE